MINSVLTCFLVICKNNWKYFWNISFYKISFLLANNCAMYLKSSEQICLWESKQWQKLIVLNNAKLNASKLKLVAYTSRLLARLLSPARGRKGSLALAEASGARRPRSRKWRGRGFPQIGRYGDLGLALTVREPPRFPSSSDINMVFFHLRYGDTVIGAWF